MKRNRYTSPDELRFHAMQLAVAFNVRLLDHDTLGVFMLPDGTTVDLRKTPERSFAIVDPDLEQRTPPIVVAPYIKNEPAYAITMHELGHICAPTGIVFGHTASAGLILLEEESAWEWARHYALEWTDLMENVAEIALRAYRAGGAQFAAQRRAQADAFNKAIMLARRRRPKP